MTMAIFKSWFIDFKPFQDEEFVYSEEQDMEIPRGGRLKVFQKWLKIYLGGTPFKEQKRILEWKN